MRRLIPTVIALIALTSIPLVATAGGWGIISVDNAPAAFEADTTYSLDYRYLAHGQEPFDIGETIAVFRSSDGETLRFDATNRGNGNYSVDVVVPKGTWTWGIEDSGGWQLQSMGSVEIGAAPTPGETDSSGLTIGQIALPLAALGAALFTVNELVRLRRGTTTPEPA